MTPAVIRILRGSTFTTLLLLAGFYAATLFIFPLSMLHLLTQHPLFHNLQCKLVAAWFLLAAGLLEVVGGIKVRLFTNDKELLSSLQSTIFSSASTASTASTLLLSNHPSTADWMFLWSVVLRLMSLQQLKIMMKSQLRNVPVIGWALQSSLHCFMERKWETDQRHLQRFVNFYTLRPCSDANHRPVCAAENLQLMMFPEGTDLNPKGIVSSHSYAQKNNLPLYQFTLHPRTTGFTYLLKALGQHLKWLVDVTIAFPRHQTRKSTELMTGQWPEELHLFIRRFEVNQLKTNDEAQMSKWLKQRWEEKEDMLTRYYSDKEKNYKSIPRFTDKAGNVIPELKLVNESHFKNVQVFTLCCWLLLVVLSTLALLCYRILRNHVIVACVTYTIFTLKGGLDRIILSNAQAQTSIQTAQLPNNSKSNCNINTHSHSNGKNAIDFNNKKQA